MKPTLRTASGALLKCWIVFCATSVAAGWCLSLMGKLNLDGYLLVLGLAIVIIVFTNRQLSLRLHFHPWRLRKPLPLSFVALSVLILIGGLLHKPNNYDALTYRTPRLLHWLAVGHWHWITTANERMNYSAVNFEWLTAPLLVITRTDRLFFFLNFFPFLFLPGLVFSTYRMLGIKGKVAWNWMWILPAGYCFALQAGSIGNDAVGATLVLSSLYFALRAGRSYQMSDVAFSLLAIGIATGMKASNLPLALPCVVALWPVRKLLCRRYMYTAAVLAASIVVSYTPMAVLNHHFTGTWMGDPGNSSKLKVSNSVAALIGNSLEMGIQNFQPPLLPNARVYEIRLWNLLPRQVKEVLLRDYPRFHLELGELPQEEAVALGIGVTMLVVISLISPLIVRRRTGQAKPSNYYTVAIHVATTVAFLVFMTRMGSEAAARLLCPYYLLLLPLFLLDPANEQLVSYGWWRKLALVSVGSTAIVILLTPARPLWPAETILNFLAQQLPTNTAIARAQTVYEVYRQRNDLLGPLRECIPLQTRRVAVLADADDSDLALWKPFGAKRVIYLVGSRSWRDESREYAWIVGKTSVLLERYGISLQQAVHESGGHVVAQRSIVSKVSKGPEQWFVLNSSASFDDHSGSTSGLRTAFVH